MPFEMGDIVSWESHGVLKQGTVAGIIKGGHKAGDLPPQWLKQYLLQFPKTAPARADESYLVRVPHGKNKPKLFWPHAELLVLVNRPVSMDESSIGEAQ